MEWGTGNGNQGKAFEETVQKFTSRRLLKSGRLWGKKIKAENMPCVKALSSIIVKPKFMCLMHNEAEQTLRVWSGEKFTARAKQRGWDNSCSKTPNRPVIFRKSSYRQKYWREAAGCVASS